MPKFEERSKVYPFTTENLAGYMDNLKLRGKKVLAVTSSGDHLINSFHYGANEVTGFDINFLASLFTELKFNAVKKLNFEEFKKYFFIGNNQAMDFKIYDSLRENLSNPCLNFFDSLYNKYDFNGKTLRSCKLFNKRFDRNELRIKSNPYLFSRFNFEETKRNIGEKEISLINSNIRDLSSKLKGNFDVIFLSNLTDYAQQIFPRESNYLNLFCINLILPLKKYLNLKGTICSAYVYDARKDGEYKSQIDNPSLREKIMKNLGMNYEEIKFRSIVPGKEDKLDLVVLLKDNK